MAGIKIKLWRASWIMLIVFIALALLDFYSTFRVGEIIKYLETNPIYIYTGSWLMILFFNFLAIYLLLRAYDSPKPFNRFLACTFFVWISLLRIAVIMGNFQTHALVEDGSITIEKAQGYTTEQKLDTYTDTYLHSFILPMSVTLLVYILFRMDNKIERIDTA